VVSGNKILAGTSGGGIFISSDGGLSWSPSNSGLSVQFVNLLAVNGNDVVAAGSDLFLSTNNGTNWTTTSGGSAITNISSLCTSGRIVFAGTSGGMFLSYDNGSNWISVNEGVPALTLANQLTVSGSDILMGTYAYGVWSRPLTELKKSQAITFNFVTAKAFGDAAFNLSATSSSSLPISYISSDPTIASISANTVTILKPGTVTITANQAGDDIYRAALSAQQTLTVNKGHQQITFPALANKTIGDDAFDLTATASSSLPISFATSSNKITVTNNQVTLVNAGRVTITASQAGDSNYEAASSDQSFCISPMKPVTTSVYINTWPKLTSDAPAGNQWFMNDILMPGANQNTLDVTQSGTYKVQVKADDCASVFSDSQVLLVTGIEPSANSSIELYPNPVSDWLSILCGEESERKEVYIYRITGQQIAFAESVNKEIYLNTTDYAKGIYIAKIISGKTIKVIKFEKI
jgi:hypothetical protein